MQSFAQDSEFSLPTTTHRKTYICVKVHLGNATSWELKMLFPRKRDAYVLDSAIEASDLTV